MENFKDQGIKGNPLNKEIGGNHYKSLPIQPVVLCNQLHLNFIQGSIIKYVSRYKKKGGFRDLRKAVHFSELGIALSPKNYALNFFQRWAIKHFPDKTYSYLNKKAKKNKYIKEYTEKNFAKLDNQWEAKYITDAIVYTSIGDYFWGKNAINMLLVILNKESQEKTK